KDSAGIQERIFIVHKRYVAPNERPPFLKDREGFTFYETEDPEKFAGMEQEYFRSGAIRDERYRLVVHERGGHLWRADARMRNREGVQPAPFPLLARPNGRTVFVAKPAIDMRADYDRVVRELTQGGYTVVPPPTLDIPYTNTAVRFLDERLAQ